MNILKKYSTIILFTYFCLSLIVFLLYPITENITYIEQLKDGFISIVYFGLIYTLIQLNFPDIVYIIIIIIGNIFPIILIYKRKKIFPYLIISLMFYCIYLFIGLILFGIRKGEIV